MTFGAEQTFNEVSITILDDSLLEFTETFIGRLQLPDGSTFAVDLNPDSATASVFDDDEVVIGFLSNPEVNEGDNMAILEIGVISGIHAINVPVFVTTPSGTTAVGKCKPSISNI